MKNPSHAYYTQEQFQQYYGTEGGAKKFQASKPYNPNPSYPAQPSTTPLPPSQPAPPPPSQPGPAPPPPPNAYGASIGPQLPTGQSGGGGGGSGGQGEVPGYMKQ
eukprot:1274362-Amorphochlora_amoeboformis.AAC.1